MFRLHSLIRTINFYAPTINLVLTGAALIAALLYI